MDITKRKRIPTEKSAVTSRKAAVAFPTWKVVLKDRSGKKYPYDFSPFAHKRPVLARHFQHAFCGQFLRHKSRVSYLFALKIFWRFLDHLDSYGNVITTLDQIDSGLIELYIYWLKQNNKISDEPWNPNTQRKFYSYVKKMLEWLVIHKRQDCSVNLVFPHDVYAKASRHSTPREPYSKSELVQIMRAIEAELEEVNIKLENHYIKKNVGRDPRVGNHNKDSPWRGWENVVWYFETKLRCTPRTQRWLCKHGHLSFVVGVKFHNGLKAVWTKLGVGSDRQYTKKRIGTDPTKGAQVPWTQWNNIVWYFENVLQCEYRSINWLRDNGHHSFIRAARFFHGGIDAVWQRLDVWSSTTKQALTPFVMFFAIVTGANKTPLIEMKRDCIREDALLGRKYVTWSKTRGHSIHRSWSPIARLIVERVLHLTDSLVPGAGIDEKNLWLYNSYSNGIRSIDDISNNEFDWLIKKYNLKADDGSPLKLNITRFRPTFASRAFELCDGDIVKIRTLLNHAQLKTTQRYIHQFDKEKAEDRAFRGIANILSAIRNNDLIGRYAEKVGTTKEKVITLLRNQIFFTGLGNCLDPFRSPLKGEKAMKRCSRFWKCITCRHTLVLDTDLPELISHYNRIAQFKKSMSAKAFKKTYGFILSIIDNDILPRFSKTTVEKARTSAAKYPAPAIDLPTMYLEDHLNS